MNTKEAIYKRRSVRKFTDQKVSDEIIDELLKCAMAAPSACNKQPWEFYVVKSEEKLNEIKMVSKYSNFNAPLAIIVCGNKTRMLSDRDNDFFIQDCSAAIENMLLYATSINLGSLWCGILPISQNMAKTKEILNLNDEIIPLALLFFGYSAEEKEARTQYDDQKVHFL